MIKALILFSLIGCAHKKPEPEPYVLQRLMPLCVEDSDCFKRESERIELQRESGSR